MQQQMAVLTLGVADMARSRRFYVDGFGWTPVFENDEIVFYQMNGFVLGTFSKPALEQEMSRPTLAGAGSYALAHNVAAQADVEVVMQQLLAAGGRLLRAADAPPHGGFRGYVADPDEHAWEIAWNPAWTIDAKGMVTFGV
jgi:catechol 2,3-dioxygenase-like lactoylglutathione lyase family enzyme